MSEVRRLFIVTAGHPADFSERGDDYYLLGAGEAALVRRNGRLYFERRLVDGGGFVTEELDEYELLTWAAGAEDEDE